MPTTRPPGSLSASRPGAWTASATQTPSGRALGRRTARLLDLIASSTPAALEQRLPLVRHGELAGGSRTGGGRERVRVARPSAQLPRLSEAFARGELSYAKVPP